MDGSCEQPSSCHSCLHHDGREWASPKESNEMRLAVMVQLAVVDRCLFWTCLLAKAAQPPRPAHYNCICWHGQSLMSHC